eukprot:CAMPEP_0119549614 /NCGR_PEP_ID=MMETSP1352-20130426/3272_1 /TAXON_ID=265584 /ORGANISM="Stauroneis constricta, Strain CCMP1120" /LENGTH=675 /DNA_ID=CAMNT_0007595209 /DNA_START=143 /DNA_END=2167 /DNA_ORIENTATION=+
MSSYRDNVNANMDPESSDSEDSNLQTRRSNFGSGMGSYRDNPTDTSDDSVKESAMANARRFLWDEEDEPSSHSRISGSDISGGSGGSGKPAAVAPVIGARTASGRIGGQQRFRDDAQSVGLIDPNRGGVGSMGRPTNLSGNRSREGLFGMFQRGGTGLSSADYNDAVFHDAATSPDDMEEYLSKDHRTNSTLLCCAQNKRRCFVVLVLLAAAIVGIYTHMNSLAADGEGIPGSWEDRVADGRMDGALDALQPDIHDGSMTEAGTPQHKALKWVVADDPLQLAVDSKEFRLRYLLAAVYFSTGGDTTWKTTKVTNHGWLSGDHVCEWSGIVCSIHRDPYELNVTDFGLSGTIPLEIMDVGLLTLDMSHNSIGGTIPDKFKDSQIVNLFLRDNELVGTISQRFSFMDTLRRVSFADNKLTGTIPSQIGAQHPPVLEAIDFSGNNLKGGIPDLSRLKGMKFLYVNNNQMTGTIPNNIGVLSQLVQFRASNNALRGTIPRSMGTMSRLALLDLSNNKIGGSIPDITASLYALEELLLNDNLLVGNLPPNMLMGKNFDLTKMLLHNNKLAGPIPSSVNNLFKLQILRFDNNKMTGSIPTPISTMSNLQEFRINENQFDGTLPTELGSMSTLQILHMQENKFHGFIPTEFGDMTELTSLQMHHNHLTGTLPNEICLSHEVW